MTLKAGSKVYVPNGKNADGSNRFDEVIIKNDISANPSSLSDRSGSIFIRFTSTNPSLSMGNDSVEYSGTSTITPGWYYNTSDNILYRDNTSENISLPIARVTNKSGSGITSIDQVFNGFGYIGSTVFALPGVEGLIPNGRNSDGTCKNKKLKVNSIKIMDVGASRGTSQDKLFIYEEGSFSAWYHNGLSYNNFPSPSNGNWFRVYSKDDNLWYESDDGGAYYPVYIVKVNEEVITENYKITSIKPFSVVTKLIDQETPHIIETYRNGTSWYRVYSDGWCEQGGLWTGNISINAGQEGGTNITFMKSFNNTNYTTISQCSNAYCMSFRLLKDNNKCYYSFGAYQVARTLYGFEWYACGYIS